MSEVVGKEPCPSCRDNGNDASGDNLARYSDGGAYCFACGHVEHNKDEEISSSPVVAKKPSKLITDVEYRALVKRGISEETCKKFGYSIGKTEYGKTVHVARYEKDGKVAQKLRDAKKKFTVVGNKSAMSLFGQHLWRDGGKKIVITEGEIDALTVSQLQQNKWPVVSVPNGAQGAVKTIAQEIEWLETYEQVIFMFDQDKPGQDATEECCAVLSPGKAFVARLPLKDANEMLLAHRGAEVIQAIWDAKAWRPDGVIDIASLVDEACQDVEKGKSWPWQPLTDKTYGRRRGELYGFGGGTGCGKSTVFKQIGKHILETDNLPIGLVMLEERPALTAKTLAGMMMGKRVHVPGVEYSKAELKATLEKLGASVFLYDHFGSMKFEIIKDKIRFMVHSLGIKDIFLDHLTALASAIDTDERKAIDKIMAELSSLTQELDCTIYYVSHLTTPEGKAHEEGGRVLEKQFRGSRSIAYWSHFLFAIERDKQDEKGVTIFRVLKDRYTGDAAGLTFGLSYDTETGLLNECAIPEPAAKHGFTNEEDGEY